MADRGRREVAKRLNDPKYRLNLGLRTLRIGCLQHRGMMEIMRGNLKGL